MPDMSMTLTAEERDFLVGLLERVLKDKEIEEHRTRTLSYREIVVKEEERMKSLLAKLKTP